MSTNIKEAIKEGLRVVVLSVLPLLMAGIDPQTGAISIDTKILVGVGLLAALRAIDSWLHKSGVASKGLSRF